MNPDSHNRLNMWINAFPRLAGAIAVATGTTVIVGWIFGIEILKSLHPGMVSMKANAALAFILAGTSLLLLHSSAKSMKMKRVAQSLALLVIVIGLLTSIEYAFGWNAGIDQLLFKDSTGAAGTLHGGRMPFSAAVSFVFFGTAILVLDVRTRRGNVSSQILAISVGILGFLGLLGYIYNLPEMAGYAVHTRMAAHGAVTFIVLSIGVLALRPDDGIIGEIHGNRVGSFMARRLLPAAIGVPIVIGWITEEGESLRLYGNQFGEVIAATAYIAIAFVLTWRIARSLNQMDAERKSAAEALRQTEGHYKLMVEHASDLIYNVDSRGYITFVNPATVRMMGYLPNEVVGRRYVEFVRPDFQKRAGRLFITQFLRKTPSVYNEVPIRAKDGRELWLGHNVGLIFKNDEVVGFHVVSRDITELKRAQESLQESEEKYRTLVQNLAEGVGIVDGEERFRFANAAADTIFGVPAGSLVGRSLQKFMDPNEFEKVREQTVKRRKGEAASYEIQIIRPDREKRHLLATVSPFIGNEGTYVGAIGIFRDLTERKRAEQERESLIEELKTALENVRTLDGLVPICAHCKKIRDDKGYWNQLEKYIVDHTDAKLTHGLCPDCAQLYFPGIAAKTTPGGKSITNVRSPSSHRDKP